MNTLHIRKQSGFTLVELAIVLVIIGLIIGGVLVGRDMIEAAGLRATAGQIEKYKTAVNAFRNKYNCLPGDCGSAPNFGFAARSGADGHGDGDTRYENCSSASSHYAQGCENLLFWRDLSTAGLIGDSFTAATDANVAIAAADLERYFPKAKVGNGSYVAVYNTMNTPPPMTFLSSYTNFFSVTGIDDIAAATGGVTTSSQLTPTQAYQYDSKVDDGIPTTGQVFGGTNQTTSFYAGGPWLDACAVSATQYNLDAQYANERICVLNIKM